MYKLLFPVLLVLVLISRAGAQQFAFPESAAQAPAMLSKAIVSLAGQALAVYKDDDREKYLSNLLRGKGMEEPFIMGAWSAKRKLARNGLRGSWSECPNQTGSEMMRKGPSQSFVTPASTPH
jgi:hypothetical protein